jgi:hypothetical protein
MGKENEQPLSRHCAGEKKKKSKAAFFLSRSLSFFVDHIKSAA